MVRTKAPLLSLGASGAVGGVLVASNWRGRPYMKKLTIPTNPNTPAQISVRAMMRYLTQLWSKVAKIDQSTWDEPATAANITRLDAFVRENLSRWGRFLPPGDFYPVPDSASVPSLSLTSTTATGRGVLITVNTYAGTYPANLILHHSTSPGFSPAYTTAIWLQRATHVQEHTFMHTPLPSGTHYYRINANSQAGNTGAYTGEKSAVVA